METTNIALFKGKRIRRIIFHNEWWFSVVDVCEVLTESVDAGAYWRKLKQRLQEEGSEVVTFCHGLKIRVKDEDGVELSTFCRQLKLDIGNWDLVIGQNRLKTKCEASRQGKLTPNV